MSARNFDSSQNSERSAARSADNSGRHSSHAESLRHDAHDSGYGQKRADASARAGKQMQEEGILPKLSLTDGAPQRRNEAANSHEQLKNHSHTKGESDNPHRIAGSGHKDKESHHKRSGEHDRRHHRRSHSHHREGTHQHHEHSRRHHSSRHAQHHSPHQHHSSRHHHHHSSPQDQYHSSSHHKHSSGTHPHSRHGTRHAQREQGPKEQSHDGKDKEDFSARNSDSPGDKKQCIAKPEKAPGGPSGQADHPDRHSSQDSPSKEMEHQKKNSDELRGRNNQEKIFNYFVNKGLSPAQAAGIVGNTEQENGSRTNDTRGGLGIGQWIGGRRHQLQQFAAENGKHSTDLKPQLDFMWKELNTTEKKALQALRKTHSPSEAAKSFSNNFERPGMPMLRNRQRYAENAFIKYGANSSQTDKLPETNQDSCADSKTAQASRTSDLENDPKEGFDDSKQGESTVNDRASWAEQLSGQQLWKDYAGATQHGNLGCAISVARALQHSGVQIPDILDVKGIRNYLVGKMNWSVHPASQKQPGDVFYGLGGQHGHIGIVGADGKNIWNNSSSHGRTWSLTSEAHGFGRFHGNVFVLRPRN